MDGFDRLLRLLEDCEWHRIEDLQSEKFFESVRAEGLPVAYLPFEGEQHGFRKAENLKRSIEAEFYFYSKIFGFEPADPIEPVHIENLESYKGATGRLVETVQHARAA